MAASPFNCCGYLGVDISEVYDTHLPETASILAQVLNLRGLVHRF
uniref:Uncharacterized protein n=1 Tax=Escherichia coli TaxID=562 RepID=A0A3G1E0K5_ECOLX|nr:hypothetical protein plasmid_0001 [Escherichia coli]QQP62619.1 hypothetical protein [Escherichia coli]